MSMGLFGRLMVKQMNKKGSKRSRMRVHEETQGLMQDI